MEEEEEEVEEEEEEKGEAFYVLVHMRGKAFPLQIMKLSYSAFALLAFLPTLKGSFSAIHQIKSSHLTPHPPPNCSTKCIFRYISLQKNQVSFASVWVN